MPSGLGRNAGKSAETCGRGFIKSWAGFARPECRTAEKTFGPRTHTAPEGEDTQAEHAEPPEYAADLCCRGRNAGKSSGTHCRGFIKSWTGFARPERRTAEKTRSPRKHTAPEGEHAGGTCGFAGIRRRYCGDADGMPENQRRRAAGVSKNHGLARLSVMPDSREDVRPPDAHCPRR